MLALAYLWSPHKLCSQIYFVIRAPVIQKYTIYSVWSEAKYYCSAAFLVDTSVNIIQVLKVNVEHLPQWAAIYEPP